MLQPKHMDKSQEILELIARQGLVPLFYHDDENVCMEVTTALYDGGVRILEFTNRGPRALDNFRKLRGLVNSKLPGLKLGIGTIKTESDTKAFLEAGADFIVCPIIHPGIAAISLEAGVLWIPGCLTATEIAQAEAAGATLVKIFPGSLVGPDYIAAIRDIFPAVKFMPTGGVDMTAENIGAWFNAGVVAVGMGSKLITKKILESSSYHSLTTAAADALAIVQAVKK
jgi:2-dehydro-3-deoxyphosphogluconate aldolase / (4S)-4-hydroxy-2-oxoglutarate aldolase